MRTRRSQSSSDPVSEGPSTLVGVKHRSVLLHEAVEALDVQPTDTVVDGTLGAAGHAQKIAEKLGRGGVFVGFDLDADAVGRAEVALAHVAPKVILINANFRHLKQELESREIMHIDKALFDLGWSSDQLAAGLRHAEAGSGLAKAGRGFSFQADEPLLMTYSNSPAPNALTAATIVNEWGESSIADVLYGWGEEHYSRRIAKAIVERRARKQFTTARELAEVIHSAVPAGYRRGKLHPATKTFQALRIAVNDELGALQEGLRGARELLNPAGRIAVITFHSIEDRIVKRTFADWERSGFGTRVNKKPVVAGREELRENPRARSAKLRIFEASPHLS